MAAFANDPLVVALPAWLASPLETQPITEGLGGVAPTISDEIPIPGSTVPPPLTLVEFLVD